MENSEVQLADAATPGQRLREAREAAGISPREMADRLNWLPSYIAAIEEDRYESLRSPAFVRGYLRAYARSLGLNADELVDSFDSLTGGTDQDQHDIVSPISPASNQKTGLSVVMGIVIALAVIGLIWWQSESEPVRESALAPSSETEKGPSQLASPQSVQPPAAAAVEAQSAQEQVDAGALEPEEAPPSHALTALVEAEDDAAAETETAGVADVASAGSTAVSEENPATAGTGSVSAAVSSDSQASSGGRDADAPLEMAGDATAPDAERAPATLQFAFSGDCWLEVRDAGGALIYADLRGAGDTLDLDGTPPFKILAGDAGAVTLRYRGDPFPVRARPGRAIARFIVGEP